MARTADVSIRYVVDVVDKGSRQLSAIHKRIEQAARQSGRTAETAARKQVEAQRQVTQATSKQATEWKQLEQAATRAERNIAREALATSTKVDSATRKQVEALRKQGVGYREIAQRQRAAGRSATETAAAIDRASRREQAALKKSADGRRLFSRSQNDLIRGSARLRTGMSSMFLGGGAVAAGITGVYALARGFGAVTRATGEAQVATAKVRGVLASTGHAANVTLEQVDALSDSIARQIGVDDELIKEGAAIMLTFKNVRNEAGATNKVFDQSIRQATNLSLVFGQDIPKAATMLGKALQEPAKGVGALRRVGAVAQADVENIKRIEATNGRLAAQRAILKAVDDQVGKVAREYATTLPAATGRARFAFGELMESIGEKGGGGRGGPLTRAANAVADFVFEMRDGVGQGGRFANTLKDLASGAKSAAMWVGKTTAAIVKFTGAGSGTAKVAGGLIAVAAAVKLIRFAGAITGVTRLAKAINALSKTTAGARLAAAIVTPLTRLPGRLGAPMARFRTFLITRATGAGVAAGAGAAAGTGTGLARDLPGAVNSKRGRLRETMRNFGRFLGGATAAGFVLAYNEDIRRGIQKLGLGDPNRTFGGSDLSPTGKPGGIQDLFKGRTWRGIIPGFQSGGLVPSLVSSGEMLVDPAGRASMVPGPRVAADNVMTALRPGTAVLTQSGQALLAAGASLRDAVRMQMPHFQKGGVASGSTGARAIGGGGTLSLTDLVALSRHVRMAKPALSAAVAMGESRGRMSARNLSGIEDSMGPWQINTRAHPQYNKTRLRTDPVYTANAAKEISSGGRDWSPWTVFTRGLYKPWYAQAQRISAAAPAWRGGAGRGAPGDPAGRTVTTRTTTFPDALDPSAGFAAGRELAEFNRPLRGLVPGMLENIVATVNTSTRTIPGVSSGGSRGTRGTPGTPATGDTWRPGMNTLSWGQRFARKFGLRISSSYRSPAHNRAVGGVPGSYHTRGTPSNPGALDLVPPSQAALAWARRHAKLAEAMIHDAGSGPHIHLGFAGFRRGGIVQRFRRGGFSLPDSFISRGGGSMFGGARGALPSAPITSVSARGGIGASSMLGALNAIFGPRATDRVALEAALSGFADMIDSAVKFSVARLDELQETAQRNFDRLKAVAKPTAKQRDQLNRWAAVLNTVNAEFGKRVQMGINAAAEALADLDRGRTTFDQQAFLRGTRTDSRQGQEALATFIEGQIARANDVVRDAGENLRTARRRDDPELIRDAQAAVREAKDKVAELTVSMVEAQVAAIEATTQELMDEIDRQRTRVEQRLTLRNVDPSSSRGLKTMARFYERSIEQMQQLQDDLEEQLASASGARAAALQQQIRTLSDSITQASVDMIEAQRQAIIAAAQERVDMARHRSTLANYRLERLELQQRLAGTFEQGGAERAAFITGTIIPALEKELRRLEKLRDVAREQRDKELARETAEQIAAKQNEILQAQLTAQEQIKANTDNLRDLAGALGFEFSGQAFTDLVGVGTGA